MDDRATLTTTGEEGDSVCQKESERARPEVTATFPELSGLTHAGEEGKCFAQGPGVRGGLKGLKRLVEASRSPGALPARQSASRSVRCLTIGRLMKKAHGLQWPCPDPSHPGTPRLHTTGFARGRGQLSVVRFARGEPGADTANLSRHGLVCAQDVIRQPVHQVEKQPLFLLSAQSRATGQRSAHIILEPVIK